MVPAQAPGGDGRADAGVPASTGQGRDKGRTAAELEADVEAEVADVLAMLLLFARHHGVDVEAALDRKWVAYRAGNATGR